MTTTEVRCNYYVYVYKYPDGTPFYVGKGTGKRWKQHLIKAKTNSKDYNEYKRNIIKKLFREGKEPIVEKILDNIDNELACLVEQEYISKYGRKSQGGLLVNMTAGGDGCYDLDPEIREKKKLKLIEIGKPWRFKKGGVAPMKGRKHSPEAIQNMRLAHKGSKGNLGYRYSPEGIEKMKQVLLRDKWTCNVCNKSGLGKGAGNRWHFANCKLLKEE